MLEAIPPNTEANIAPLLCLWSFWEFGQYFPYFICQCVTGCAVIVLYLLLVKSCVQSGFYAIFQKFNIVCVGVSIVNITTFKVKFKCHKSQVFCFW